MANTTFSGPVRSENGFIAATKNATTGVITENGYATFVASAEVTFGADGATTTICTVPANSQIIEIYVDVTTAFDAGTTNTFDIGNGSTADQFADALDVSSAGRVLGSSDASQLANYVDVGASNVSVVVTYNQSGTAATAGAARVTVLFAANNNLS